ncbi:hypothetical protein SDC9_145507 [bioreactor metagenome]|uniref:Uncharacterized protein n=1 Tax=bioreactor metagenome TaxID=1076179 RepID=A0A645ECE2_9ZZZZ
MYRCINSFQVAFKKFSTLYAPEIFSVSVPHFAQVYVCNSFFIFPCPASTDCIRDSYIIGTIHYRKATHCREFCCSLIVISCLNKGIIKFEGTLINIVGVIHGRKRTCKFYSAIHHLDFIRESIPHTCSSVDNIDTWSSRF